MKKLPTKTRTKSNAPRPLAETNLEAVRGSGIGTSPSDPLPGG